MTEVVTTGNDPRQVIPALFEELKDRDPQLAERFDEMWSEIFKELRRDEVTDPQMVKDCLAGLVCHLNKTASTGEVFEQREGAWAFWPQWDWIDERHAAAAGTQEDWSGAEQDFYREHMDDTN